MEDWMLNLATVLVVLLSNFFVLKNNTDNNTRINKEQKDILDELNLKLRMLEDFKCGTAPLIDKIFADDDNFRREINNIYVRITKLETRKV